MPGVESWLPWGPNTWALAWCLLRYMLVECWNCKQNWLEPRHVNKGCRHPMLHANCCTIHLSLWSLQIFWSIMYAYSYFKLRVRVIRPTSGIGCLIVHWRSTYSLYWNVLLIIFFTFCSVYFKTFCGGIQKAKRVYGRKCTVRLQIRKHTQLFSHVGRAKAKWHLKLTSSRRVRHLWTHLVFCQHHGKRNAAKTISDYIMPHKLPGE